MAHIQTFKFGSIRVSLHSTNHRSHFFHILTILISLLNRFISQPNFSLQKPKHSLRFQFLSALLPNQSSIQLVRVNSPWLLLLRLENRPALKSPNPHPLTLLSSMYGFSLSRNPNFLSLKKPFLFQNFQI